MTLINDIHKKYITPKIIETAKQIDNDIRSCIKQEIKE